MIALPTGTVTFLLTDVEGSTALWEEAPEAMRAALARHDALFERAVGAYGGMHIRPRGEGDSRFAVFSSAPGAVAAALAIQRAFAEESWPTPRPVTVRIGVHTGPAELLDGDYYGSTVNRCARIRAIGRGGQTLLSETTATQARDQLPEAAVLHDLGPYRLRDLAVPERLFQLTAPDLPARSPSVGASATVLHNLTVPPTPLIGREREVEALHALFARDDVRLVTLTGPGGVGKTRLALQVMAELVDGFADGAYFVALAQIGEPELVPITISQALGLRDMGSYPLLESLHEHLRRKRLLLLLDNLEQLPEAGSAVADLLAASPGLKVMATSRSPLNVRGEHELEVPPLALPERGGSAAGDVSRYGAVALFIARATAIKPDFGITDESAPAMVEICQRLDGLPLAIELAAARVRVLPPQAMLPRLGQRLQLLTGGARDLPARHRTLRQAIAWSYDLLDDEERALFRRLSIFVGSFTLGAGCWVIGDGEADGSSSSPITDDLSPETLDLVASLVAKNLLRRDDTLEGEPRFTMLETIREYGLEQLQAAGEADPVRRRHAAYFLALAEEAAPELHGRDQLGWLRRLDAAHADLRAILAWSRDGQVDGDVGLRIVGALAWFWYFRGLAAEGHGWASAILAMPGAEARTVARAQALQAASLLANMQANYTAQSSLARESVAIFREHGEMGGAGRSLAGEAIGEMNLGNREAARALYEASATCAQDADDSWGLAFGASQFGALEWIEGNYEVARARLEECIRIAGKVGDRFTLGLALGSLANAARLQGRHGEATELFKQALVVANEFREQTLVPRALAGLAGLAGLGGEHARAARLFGAAEAEREATGRREIQVFRAINERDTAETRAALGETAFAAAWAAGRALSLEQAIAYALGEESTA